MRRLFSGRAWAAFPVALCLGLSALVEAAPALRDVIAVPQLDAGGRAGYAEFLQSPEHRAFVIAPGGAWSWIGEMPNVDLALQTAMQDCQTRARQRCLTYALDDQVLFDAREWAGAWGPYLKRAEAARARIGLKPGQRYPDLSYNDASGKVRKLSDDRGRVVVLHFWGSWCPTCQREMPDLQKLYDRFKSASNVRFVFMSVREPVARSRAWTRGRGLSVPISDGGPLAEKEGAFLLADGRKIGDRDVARVFPTTYVLDRHGVVLFSRYGSAERWGDYAPQLLDAAARSGR